MSKLIMTPRRVNCTGRWSLAVKSEGETLAAEVLERQLMGACHLDRQQIKQFRTSLRQIVAQELSAGNSVNLFDLVRIGPSYKVTARSVATEGEAWEMLAHSTDIDVQTRLVATVLPGLGRLGRRVNND